MKTFLFLFFFFQEKLEIISLSRCNNYIATVETIDRTKDKILKKKTKKASRYIDLVVFSQEKNGTKIYLSSQLSNNSKGKKDWKV